MGGCRPSSGKVEAVQCPIAAKTAPAAIATPHFAEDSSDSSDSESVCVGIVVRVVTVRQNRQQTLLLMLLLLLRHRAFCHICGISMHGWMLRCGGETVGGMNAAPTPLLIVTDIASEWVTIWKNILSLFAVLDANRFEGAGLLRWLADGWYPVDMVLENKPKL